MNPDEVMDALREIMVEHDLDCATEGEWVVPNGKLPAIRAHWHPGENSGLLAIHVLVAPGVVIEECFGGVGEGAKGFGDALTNFMVNSLHVLLSAFWGKSDSDQVLVEQWRIGGRKYIAHIGDIGVRTSAGVDVSPPEGLVPAVKIALECEKARDHYVWCRVFFASISNEHTYETLLNNQKWPAALERMKELQWPRSRGFFSFRNFIVCVAA